MNEGMKTDFRFFEKTRRREQRLVQQKVRTIFRGIQVGLLGVGASLSLLVRPHEPG
jgi:hypothetical protein